MTTKPIGGCGLAGVSHCWTAEVVLTDCNIAGQYLDSSVLTQTHGQSMVHDQKTGLDQPYREALHLLDNKYHLGSSLMVSMPSDHGMMS